MGARVRQIRRRIGNVRHVRQITKAMYTIAATQVIQRKRSLFAARPFVEAARVVLSDLAATASREEVVHPLLHGVSREGTAVLVISSDRGLCGRYVGDLNRAGASLARQKAEVRVLAGGDKAYRYFRRSQWPLTQSYVHSYDRPTVEIARQMRDDLLSLYGTEVGEAHIVYTYFRGELVQQVQTERLLPLDLPTGRPRDLLAEPSLAVTVDELAHLYLTARLLEVLLEAKASEHAIRRQAMKAATDNADELMEKLTLSYNKARQQRITTELADIMGGAEALREE